MPPLLRESMPHLANAYASAVEPPAVMSQETTEKVPTSASFVGSMMMPEPIMLRAVSIVSCVTLILLEELDIVSSPE